MPPPAKYRKNRPRQRTNKNDLKVSRNEQEEQQRIRAGTLSERFPRVNELRIDLRMETASGAVLENIKRTIRGNEALTLDIACQGGCGNGLFLLQEAAETLLQEGRDDREGMAVCQAASYQDPKLPCGTKLYFHLQAAYQ